MSTTINSFVGLFGRQDSIVGLEIPEWVTIYIDDVISFTKTEHCMLDELIEGIATIGSVGVTLVYNNLSPGNWRQKLDFSSERHILLSRPYFRTIECTLSAANEENGVVAGKLMVFSTGGKVVKCPKVFNGMEVVFIDHATTLVAKTTHFERLVADALEQVAELDVRDLPHWETDLSTTILNSATVLLALNMLCKPDRFDTNTFMFASDYVDEVVARAFVDRNLRARWRKPTLAMLSQAMSLAAQNETETTQ